MKLLSMMTVIATTSLFSFQAMGSGVYHRAAVESKIFKGDVVASQSQAYESGKQIWMEINGKGSMNSAKSYLKLRKRWTCVRLKSETGASKSKKS